MPDSAPPARPDPYVIPSPDDGSGHPAVHPSAEHPAGHPSAEHGSAGAGPSPGEEAQPPGPAASRQARLVGLLAVLAVVTAVALPPVGVVLGAVTLVSAVRQRTGARFLRMPARGASMAGGLIALVVGGVLSVVSVVFGDELGRHGECLAGANTRVAEQNCHDEFRDAWQRRLPGG